MNAKKKTVFLPVETMAREYQYKLVLASKLASKGFRVVLGHASYIDKIKNNFSSGVYIGKNLFKTLFPTDLSVYHSYKNQGWSLLHLDEEGAIFAGRESEWQQELNGRLDPNVLSDDDKILTWGTFQAEYYNYRLNKEREVKVIPTGQPKFYYKDLLYSSILDIDFQGKFILFNMNYSVFNDQIGITNFLESKDSYRLDSEDNYQYKRSMWLDQISNIGVILSVINRMLNDKAFDSYRFVVRPHPAENEFLYKVFFKGNDRVIVTNSFTAVEWSKKACCTIHDGCTTGVEAYLAGCKVINYREQFRDDMAINIIPNSVGLNSSSYEDLKEKVLSLSKQDAFNDNPLCSKMILNFDTEVDSFARVVNEVVDSLAPKLVSSVSKNLLIFDFFEVVKSFFKFFFRKFFSVKQSNYLKDRKKFNGFDRADVMKKIAIANGLENYDVKLSRFNKYYIIIE